jgi:hypothetical protein
VVVALILSVFWPGGTLLAEEANQTFGTPNGEFEESVMQNALPTVTQPPPALNEEEEKKPSQPFSMRSAYLGAAAVLLIELVFLVGYLMGGGKIKMPRRIQLPKIPYGITKRFHDARLSIKEEVSQPEVTRPPKPKFPVIKS